MSNGVERVFCSFIIKIVSYHGNKRQKAYLKKRFNVKFWKALCAKGRNLIVTKSLQFVT